MSFSNRNLSVVRHRCCRCRKFFTFSSSSREPLGKFQPNLAQSIHGLREFKFVQMKGPALFQGEIITKYLRYILRKLKNLLLKHWVNFNQTWHKAFLGDEDSSFFQFNSIKEELENGYLAIIFITYKSCCWFIFFLKTKEFYLYLRKENVGLGFYLETLFDCDPPPLV